MEGPAFGASTDTPRRKDLTVIRVLLLALRSRALHAHGVRAWTAVVGSRSAPHYHNERTTEMDTMPNRESVEMTDALQHDMDRQEAERAAALERQLEKEGDENVR
jgi:hypothetical protein